MTIFQSLSNQLLIAMPHMDDPYFSHTVCYLCEHTQKGAVGFVLNKPLSVKISDIFDDMEIKYSKRSPTANLPVMFGGPTEQRKGFVLHEPQSKPFISSLSNQALSITTSRDVLETFAQTKNKKPERLLLSLGYAGWEAGQLEKEIKANLWLTAPIDLSIIFDLPFAERWDAATRTLGFFPEQLSIEAGHA
jgi:putative transcriptional regulator